MKNLNTTTILEYIHYTQLMVHSLNEENFNDYVLRHRTTNLRFVYSTLISAIQEVNDNKLLDEDYLKRICDFLNFEITDAETLIVDLGIRFRQFDFDDTPITFCEFKNALQCIHFIVNTDAVDINKFWSLRDFMNTVRSIKNNQLV